MLSIRLSRRGPRRKAFYRLIVTEKSRDTQGKFNAILGTYDPHSKKAELKADEIKEWIAKGAQPTPTVHNLLIGQGIIEGEKVRASKSRPGKKKQAQAETEKAEKDQKTDNSSDDKEPKAVEEKKEETK